MAYNKREKRGGVKLANPSNKKNKGSRDKKPTSSLNIYEKNLPKNATFLYGKHAVFSAILNKKRDLFKLLLNSKKVVEFREFIKDKKIQLPKGFEVLETHGGEISKVTGEDAVHQGFLLFCSNLPRLNLDSFLEKNHINTSLQNADGSYNLSQKLPAIIILDQITDPHNVGALIRSAVAFNFKGIIVTHRNSPKDSSVIAKTSVGTCESIDIIEVGNLNDTLKQLREVGYWCVGLDGYAKSYIDEVDGDNIAVIIGSEGKGMRDLVKKNCDMLVKIPMESGAESLNASVAGSIAMYQLNKGNIQK